MSQEAFAAFEKARLQTLRALPCVWCGIPAGEHSLEELTEHLRLDGSINVDREDV